MSFNGLPDGERRVKEGPLSSFVVPTIVAPEPEPVAPAPEPIEAPAEEDCEEPCCALPTGLGVAATLTWVNGDTKRAATALEAEKASKGARTHLLAELEAILNPDGE